MQQFGSRKEKANYFHTLSSVLFAFKDKSLVIDLKNETTVCGIVEEVDGFMNVDLREVVFVDEKGKQHLFDQFYVPKRKIRYVHLPKDVSFLIINNNFIQLPRIKMRSIDTVAIYYCFLTMRDEENAL
ncbi:U7 snRNA-associated Sm-like protein LSm10 [Lutzomyia longipalpis]|uniref:U7 snRNA-associated Sm-like protein LSm10 n=1 Tax=Lutzomyia longipalpis TaxID=7200 RepID=UPI002483CE4D|nr:U7 snRNA-associated Sm-like protein LSm10 [Lutzomyia longipalpis]